MRLQTHTHGGEVMAFAPLSPWGKQTMLSAASIASVHLIVPFLADWEIKPLSYLRTKQKGNTNQEGTNEPNRGGEGGKGREQNTHKRKQRQPKHKGTGREPGKGRGEQKEYSRPDPSTKLGCSHEQRAATKVRSIYELQAPEADHRSQMSHTQ